MRLSPAWRVEAAPVLSGRVGTVGDAEPEAVGLRELGTLRGLVGWRMVELAAGAPVLRTTDEILVVKVVLALVKTMARGYGTALTAMIVME